jgi:dTDP-4-amino-4,6-dideoxygalactose transaminase
MPIKLCEPQMGAPERDMASMVMRSGRLAQGPMVEWFEASVAKLCGAPYAVAVSSGTAALYLALLARRVGKGCEVITSPFTFAATVNAILWTGATPVCVDVEYDTLNIDPNMIRAAVTNKTVAIMPVHLYGHICDMKRINSIAASNGFMVIEDACQAFGAQVDGTYAGSLGGVGCFSFYATKGITTGGEGGMVVTGRKRIADTCRLLRNHGMRNRYVYEAVGYNFKMTEMQAAIGLAQLDRFDEMQARRAANARYYLDNLKGVDLPAVRPGYVHAWHQFTIRSERRDEIAQALMAASVETGVFYPSLAMLGDYPVAQQATRTVLSLPVHPGLTQDDLEKIVMEVNKCSS